MHASTIDADVLAGEQRSVWLRPTPDVEHDRMPEATRLSPEGPRELALLMEVRVGERGIQLDRRVTDDQLASRQVLTGQPY